MNNNKILAVKKRYNYTQEQSNAISAITLNSKKVVEFGSWTLKLQSFFADIDLFEEYEVCCSQEQLIKNFTKRIHTLIKELPPIYIFSEFKAGIDYRFDIDIGDNFEYQLIGFNSLLVRKKLQDLFNQKLLSKDEFNELYKLSPPSPTKDQWDLLGKLLRDKYIIRWSKEEILQKYKILPGNLKLSLEDALKAVTPIKIDIITLIDCNFVEVTNFFILAYRKSKNLKQILSNLPQNYYESLNSQLVEEIDKLLFNKQYFSPFKAIKRMFALARAIEDQKTIKLFTPILRSDISRIYQIKSNIDALQIVMQYFEDNFELIPSKKKNQDYFINKHSKKRLTNIQQSLLDYLQTSTIKEVDNFRLRLSLVVEFEIPKKIYKLINKIILQEEKELEWTDIIKILDQINNILKEIINKKSIEFLKSINYYPHLPSQYLLTAKNIIEPKYISAQLGTIQKFKKEIFLPYDLRVGLKKGLKL